MTSNTYGGISAEGSDVSVTIEVNGPDEDEVENVARHARDAAVRAMQAHVTGKHPVLTDGCPISVDWNKVDAVDDTPGPFPNGVYLIADTPRTATPLAVEDGSGDRDLLREALSNHDAIGDVLPEFVFVVANDRADVGAVTTNGDYAAAERDRMGGKRVKKALQYVTEDDFPIADGGTDFPTDEPGDTYMTDGGVDEDTLRRAVNAVDDGRVKSAQYNAERGRGRFLVDSGDIDEDDVVGTIPAVDITQVDVEPADDSGGEDA